jgi:CheY-like chemotaxis protein
MAFRRVVGGRMNRVVLVVDDDPAFLDLVADLLAVEGGLDVAVAGDGEAALVQMRQRWPALVLLDLKMADVDGFEFCRRVRQDPALAEIPIVAITAWGPVDTVRAKALGAGCTGFLAKPFTLDELLSVVSRWLPNGSRPNPQQALVEP